MINVYFVLHTGEEVSVEAKENHSLMSAAVGNGVPGIVAECGGAAMCATCHVYVDDAWVDRIDPAEAIEEELLESVMAQRRPCSRLACQINARPDLDGIVLYVPDRQS